MSKEIDIDNEISKLIQFGFDLHKSEIDYDFYGDIPNVEDYTGMPYPIKKVENGGILGFRNYPNHSDSTVWTILGVSIGKFRENEFDFEFGMSVQANNKNNVIYCNLLKLKNGTKNVLERNQSVNWKYLTDEERSKCFRKLFEFVGFNKEDVIKVLNGKMTAREAYQHVAPDEIKNLQWVNRCRSYYWFDNNVAIEGTFSSVDFDYFPFPFDENPILDCSKVATCWLDHQSNKRRVELINVNKNKNSILYSDLKNIIINEPIDLSLVDANGTTFGHHTVINLESSIADLKNMDLTLAVDEKGKRFVVDDNGRIQLNELGQILTTTSNLISNNNNLSVQIFANADNFGMANTAATNNALGIGLVRTEHILKNKEDIKSLIEYCTYYRDKTFMNKLTRLQIEQALAILRSIKNQKIVFRLFDFKLNEFSKCSNLSKDKYASYENLFKQRGARILTDCPGLVSAQVKAIFAVAERFKLDFDLLVPMLTNIHEFKEIKKLILQKAKNFELGNFRIGGMIENIEMAHDADLLAKEADFITFGTNDLTESVTGLDRSTNSIEFQLLDDEVKNVINEAIYRARVANPSIPIGFCGNHGNYVNNLEFYYDLGASYVSCDPAYVKTAKRVLEQRNNLKEEKQQELVRVLKKVIDKQN